MISTCFAYSSRRWELAREAAAGQRARNASSQISELPRRHQECLQPSAVGPFPVRRVRSARGTRHCWRAAGCAHTTDLGTHTRPPHLAPPACAHTTTDLAPTGLLPVASPLPSDPPTSMPPWLGPFLGYGRLWTVPLLASPPGLIVALTASSGVVAAVRQGPLPRLLSRHRRHARRARRRQQRQCGRLYGGRAVSPHAGPWTRTRAC
eukprot:2101857-Prymnesium_polylepis.2